MATVNEIIKLIDDSVIRFNDGMPEVQRQLFDEVIELASKLETKNGRIAATAKNVRLIGEIKQRFEKLITRNKSLNEKVNEFTKVFSEVEKLQTQYFSESVKKFSAPKILSAIREESVNATIESLKGSGMKSVLIEPVRDILRTNITSGAKFTDLTKGLRQFLLDTKVNEGALVKHVKQITTDSLNTYARTNLKTISADLGFKWYSYNGAIIDTSRDFCIALHKKKYFHESEIPKIIKGDFKEFKDIDGKINAKTGLPYGMKEETNESNFIDLAGGFQCNHQPIPVDELAVPQRIKDAVK